MSLTKCLASQNSCATLSLHANSSHRFYANPQLYPISGFPITGKTMTTLITTTAARRVSMIVYADGKPDGAPPPAASGSPSSTWKNWVFGFLMTFTVPFFTTKGGPIKALMQKVDHVVDTAEHISDVVEAVADKVDKVVEELSDNVPDGSKIQKTLEFIEDVAERVEKDAHAAGDFIDKVQEMQEKIENVMEPVFDEAKEVAKEVDHKQISKNK